MDHEIANVIRLYKDYSKTKTQRKKAVDEAKTNYFKYDAQLQMLWSQIKISETEIGSTEQKIEEKRKLIKLQAVHMKNI